MARILAIDWDRHEARALLLASGPTGMSVLGAWATSLATADPAGLTGKQIGTRLAAAMSGQNIGKVTTLVGAGRDNVQMKLLTLPPAPANELPELVRFQAEREFTALGEGTALDFIPLSGDSAAANQVLAVALSSTGLTEACEVCQAIGVEPDRIPLRTCAAAALVHRAGVVGAEETSLVINPLFDEADLVVQSADKAVLMRTVRLPDPGQPEARERALLGEIRRTIAAVRQQLTDRQVDRVVICGNAATLDYVDSFTGELGLPVAMFDPATQAPSGLASRELSAETLARFSAALGMALTEADRREPTIDFANPRRQVEARRFERVHALALAAAVAAVSAIALYFWFQHTAYERQLAELDRQFQETQAQADVYKNVTANAAAMDRWLATDVNWLDEIDGFAHKVRPQPLSAKEYPIAKDAVMTSLTVFRPAGNDAIGGRMALKAVAKSPAAVAELEQRLRDDRHRVTTGVGQQDHTVPGYDWSFGLDVNVTPEVEAQAGAKR